MDSILNKIWEGNISPEDEYTREDDELFFRAMYATTKAKEKLEQALSQEQKALYNELMELMEKQKKVSERLLFRYAFKLGVNLVSECVSNNTESNK